MSPDRTFRLSGSVNITVSAGLAQPLSLAADTYQFEVVVIFQLILYIINADNIFRMCRYRCSEFFHCFRLIALGLSCISRIIPCRKAAVQTFYIFHTCPEERDGYTVICRVYPVLAIADYRRVFGNPVVQKQLLDLFCRADIPHFFRFHTIGIHMISAWHMSFCIGRRIFLFSPGALQDHVVRRLFLIAVDHALNPIRCYIYLFRIYRISLDIRLFLCRICAFSIFSCSLFLCV